MKTGRDNLPDPALWSERRSPHGAALRRIGVVAACLVLGLLASAFALRGVLGRARDARHSAAALVDGLAAPGALPAERPEPRAASPEELAALQKSWIGSESFAPRDDRVDPASGELVAPFHGFGLQVDSVPSGARVLVNGEEMGTSPLLTTVDCRPGDEVTVQLERGGERASARTRCRKDRLVKLRLRLARHTRAG
jgi:hypothetical protein